MLLVTYKKCLEWEQSPHCPREPWPFGKPAVMDFSPMRFSIWFGIALALITTSTARLDAADNCDNRDRQIPRYRASAPRHSSWPVWSSDWLY